MKLPDFPHNTIFLVTGGAGFIGSNIVEFLLSNNYKVKVLDNFSTGKKENIVEFTKNPNFTLIEGDIRNLEICMMACKDVNYVLHQAALGSVPRSVNDPLTSNDVNVNGTLNILIAARDNNVKKMIFASSSSAYGDDDHFPKNELFSGNTLSPYATTKRTCELYAKNFADLYNLNVIGIRYFNVFGKKQDKDSIYAPVIPKFIKIIKQEKQPVIFGDGEQTRDFTYIDNIVNANMLFCSNDSVTKGDIFNVACGNAISVNYLTETLLRIMNKSYIKPIHIEERKGDVAHLCANIEKAKNQVHYEPIIGFDEGLKKTVEWFLLNEEYL